jgi:cell division protein ZapA (FtsZ GTPase activity inhibitor)
VAVNEPLPKTESEIAQPQEPQGGKIAHDLLINVLGTKFSITAGEDPAYLEEVLAQYRFAIANTQNISGMKDPLQIAIVTGLLLCDEINKMKLQAEKEQTNADKELNRIIQNMAVRIDKIIREIRPVIGESSKNGEPS